MMYKDEGRLEEVKELNALEGKAILIYKNCGDGMLTSDG